VLWDAQIRDPQDSVEIVVPVIARRVALSEPGVAARAAGEPHLAYKLALHVKG
jgi:hypothetical protein